MEIQIVILTSIILFGACFYFIRNVFKGILHAPLTWDEILYISMGSIFFVLILAIVFLPLIIF